MRVPPIKVVVRINRSLDEVWRILFNENGWDPWFTSGMRLDPKEGGEIFFRWIIDGEEVIDRGINVMVIPKRLWEFHWNEYEDGYRSKTTIKLHEAFDGGTWVEIEDRVLAFTEKDLEIVLSCAAGWGEFITRLKLYAEKGLMIE